jgi:hypothetical protein
MHMNIKYTNLLTIEHFVIQICDVCILYRGRWQLDAMGFCPQKVWVTEYGRNYGLRVKTSGNQVGSPKKVWVITGYGL